MPAHRNHPTLGIVSLYPSIGGLLRYYLTSNARLEVAWDAHSGEEGVRFCARKPPTVLITSPMLTDSSGVEFARQIRLQHPSVRVLLFAGVMNREIVQDMIAAQVHAIVSASSPLPTLHTAVKILLEGGCYFDGVAEGLMHGPATTAERLSARERDVLRLVAEGFSTKEIAAQLGIGVKTADKFRERIMGKLNLHDAVKLARYAIRIGLAPLR